MVKKQKRKSGLKQSIAAAAYKKGMDLYHQNDDPISALKYLMKAAKGGYTKAYGEIGIILHREKNEPDEAEEWFIKAERSGSLFPAARYKYGMLHYFSKND
jgi:TPR repeat protein